VGSHVGGRRVVVLVGGLIERHAEQRRLGAHVRRLLHKSRASSPPLSDPRGQGHVPTSLAATAVLASDKSPRATWAAATRAQVMVRVSGGVFAGGGGGDWRSMVPIASRRRRRLLEDGCV